MIGKLRTTQRQRAWDRTGGQCFYCRTQLLDDFVKRGPGDLQRLMQIDHAVPIERGGDSGRQNLVPCCGACNTQKGRKTPAEFREYLIRIGIRPRFFGSADVDRDWLCVSTAYDSRIAYAGIASARRRFARGADGIVSG